MTTLSSVPLAGYAPWTRASPTRSPLIGYVRTNWSRDPFAYGAYSYLAAGSGQADRGTLAEPLGDRVHFAGEALNANYQSSVHAAHDSAIHTCEALLATPHARIGIVGAGMCGLTAAHRLAEAGREVIVLEGRDRLGGRILTDRSLGVAVDLGATWIHGPTGNPISKLADQAGLERVATDDSIVIRGRDGRQIWQIFAPSWLEDFVIQTSIGADREQMNLEETRAAFDAYGLGYAGQDVKFPNGYDEVLRSLAGDYAVRLSEAVVRIAYSPDGVQVGTSTGTQERFDAIIVTVPLGVLKTQSIAFDPPLPQSKTAAIARMGMGTLDKLYLLFDEPFWDQDATTILTPETDLPRGQFHYWVNFHKYLGAPVLLAFNSGSQALALSGDTDEQLIDKALLTLALAYPA